MTAVQLPISSMVGVAPEFYPRIFVWTSRVCSLGGTVKGIVIMQKKAKITSEALCTSRFVGVIESDL